MFSSRSLSLETRTKKIHSTILMKKRMARASVFLKYSKVFRHFSKIAFDWLYAKQLLCVVFDSVLKHANFSTQLSLKYANVRCYTVGFPGRLGWTGLSSM